MVIVGIGTDIAHIPRRVLHPEEICEFAAKPPGSIAAHRFLASRWAAKEAAHKAFNQTFPRLDFTHIRVAKLDSGRPTFVFEQTAADVASRLGIDVAHLTLSHDGDYATAYVLLESRMAALVSETACVG